MATKKKTPSLAIGRGEKLPVSKGAGLTAKGRACELCGVSIEHMRSNARFCSRNHKRMTSDSKRDWSAEYQKNKEVRQTQALQYYYADHKKSKLQQLVRQKARLPKIAAYEAARRALKMQRTPTWLTEIDKERIQNEYQLAALQTKITGKSWHVDHIIPLQGDLVSGLHVPSNLMAMLGRDNISKHNNFEVA
jgi:hypothetical protein